MKCLISLTELNDKNTVQAEYSKKGVKELIGTIKNTMRLPFTRASFVEDQPAKQQGMSISGYQPKLSLVINVARKFEVVETLGQYILKPSPENFPKLAENEHATMMVMKTLGFDIPPFGLTRFMSNEDGHAQLAFIIERYDRGDSGESIHQEQLDGAMGISEKYGKTGDDDSRYVSYEQVGQFLIKNVDSSLSFKQDLFQRVVLSYILGNNDLHLRNFGILSPKDEKARLAPVYDYVSVAAYPKYNSDYLALPLLIKEEGANGELAAGFETAFGQYIGYDFLEFGEGIGLNKKAATKYLSDIVNKEQTIIDVYNNSFVEGEQLTRIKGCVKQRIRCLTETTFTSL